MERRCHRRRGGCGFRPSGPQTPQWLLPVPQSRYGTHLYPPLQLDRAGQRKGRQMPAFSVWRPYRSGRQRNPDPRLQPVRPEIAGDLTAQFARYVEVDQLGAEPRFGRSLESLLTRFPPVQHQLALSPAAFETPVDLEGVEEISRIPILERIGRQFMECQAQRLGRRFVQQHLRAVEQPVRQVLAEYLAQFGAQQI